MYFRQLKMVEVNRRQLRLASVAGLVLGFLSLFLVAVSAILPPGPCPYNGFGQPPAGFTCHVTYPDGGAPLVVLSASEFLVLLVGSVLLVLVSSIALFYSFSRSANPLVRPSSGGTSPVARVAPR